ncbi:MAG: hypothetical protein PHT43_07245 [Anaerolineaceae bacterium]|nr:hypothetical protein [Anaerolineaceae bacterium]
MTRKLFLLMLIVTLTVISLYASDLPPRLSELPCTQNFDGPEFPADWTQTSTAGLAIDRWVPYYSNFIGGDPYELHCNSTPGSGITRLISPQLNTAGIAEITVQFLHAIGLYDLGLVFKLQYSHNLIDWYDTAWSQSTPGYNQGGLVRVAIANLDAPATYVAWTLEGDQMGMEGAVLDNIHIHLPVTELDTPEVLISDSGLVSWDAVPYAISYDIYGSDDPYGAFDFEATVEDPFWQTDITQARKFYRVKAIY